MNKVIKLLAEGSLQRPSLEYRLLAWGIVFFLGLEAHQKVGLFLVAVTASVVLFSLVSGPGLHSYHLTS